jgi:hypothetical protein
MLKFLDFTKPFKVYTNVSDFAIGGVFMQGGHLITFESNKPIQGPTKVANS